MGYRKFKADHIFNGKDLLAGNNVLITNKDGVVADIIEEKDAGDDIETHGGLISPGFINCHCHLELSHMKNVISEGTGLVDFLIKVVSTRSSVKEEINAAMEAANEEMYASGTVAVGDICNTTDSLQTKRRSRIYYHNFIEVLGFTEERAKVVLANYVNVYDHFCDAGFEKQTSIVPHAPYTISKSLFQLINDLSAGKIVSIHNQESLAEDELYQTKTGDFFKLYHHLKINTDFFQPCNKSSLQSFLPLLNKAKKILLVHNTFTTSSDVDFSFKQINPARQELYWCLCTNANLYIERVLPPVENFRQNNCDIVLGTDSYSSNRSLNILDEMKTLQKNFPTLKTEELLKWATLNGAKALNLDDAFGSFEKGKKPGVVLVGQMDDKKLTKYSRTKRIL